MADDNSKLNIDIVTKADLAGAEQAAAAQEKLIANAEKLSNTGAGLATAPTDVSNVQEFTVATKEEYLAVQQAIAGLQKRIAVLNALGESTTEAKVKLAALDKALSSESAIAVAEQMEAKAISIKTAAAAAAAAEEEERLSTQKSIATKHELRGALRVLGQQFSALRGAAYMIFNPATLGIAAIGIAVRLFEEARQKAEAFRQAMEEFNKPINVGGIAAQMGNASVAFDAAKDSADDFWHSLDQVASAEARIAVNTAAAISQLRLQAEEDAKVAEAKRNAARAEIQEQAATGKISKEEEIKRLAELDSKADAETIRRQQKLRADEIAAKKKQADELAAAEKDQTERTKKAQEANQREVEQPIRRQNLSEQLGKQIEAYKQKIAEQQKVVDSFAEKNPDIGYDPTSPTQHFARKTLQNNKDTLAALEAQKKTIDAPGYQEKVNHEAAQAAKEMQEAEAELKRIRDQKQKVDQEIKEAQAANAVQTSGENEAAQYNAKARDITTKTRVEEQQRRDQEEKERKAREEERERKRAEDEARRAANEAGRDHNADVQRKYGKHETAMNDAASNMVNAVNGMEATAETFKQITSDLSRRVKALEGRSRDGMNA